METVVVFAGGPAPSPAALAHIPPNARIVAADRGADHALAAGLTPDLVVGDLDSISPAALEAAREIQRHPPAKDATDLALALDAAVALGASEILVVGGTGGRLDHLLGELLLLAAPAYAGVQVDAHLDSAQVHVLRGERVLQGTPGELISLFAANGSAHGVTTRGLEYTLHGETLEPGSSRGLSNVFTTTEATVAVAEGTLLAIRPGAAD